jgi:hypothetical protein
MRTTIVRLALAAALVTLGTAAWAQGFGRRDGFRRGAAAESGDERFAPNVPYDGRFTFARIRYEIQPMGWDQLGRPDIKWDHDYPRAEQHFTRILREVTTLRPYVDGGNIFKLDDPELYKYPVAYMAEPGFWTMSDEEAAGLRAYLAKGGFVIFDDFAGPQWMNFEAQLRRALPGARLVRLDASHPIFDSFFRIESLDYYHPYFGNPPSEFYGVFEDNDPAKRLMVVVNYNNDLSEYWEWSDQGFFPIDISNDAYRLGVNYIIYGMTR